MDLYFTPRSHYSRKVRILLHALDLDCGLIDVGNVADLTQDKFGPNPMMKVPTLIDQDYTIFDSNHIAQYLVRKYDGNDKFNVLTNELNALNARAVLNGIMAADVELVLAARMGLDTNIPKRLKKMHDSIVNGLSWLENHASFFENQLSYLNFHLVCMWDHLAFYKILPLNYNNLQEAVKRTSDLPYIKSTSPQ